MEINTTAISFWRGGFLLFCALGVFASEIPLLEQNKTLSGGNQLKVDSSTMNIHIVQSGNPIAAHDLGKEPQPDRESKDTQSSVELVQSKPTIPAVETPIESKIQKPQHSEEKPSIALAKTSAPKRIDPKPEDVKQAQNKTAVEKAIANSETAFVTEADQAASAPSIPSEVAGLSKEVFIEKPVFQSPPAPPIYPPSARRRGHEGLVIVDALVDTKGTPNRVEIISGSGKSSLDNAALAAVETWRFVPPKVNGEFASSRVRIPIRFALN